MQLIECNLDVFPCPAENQLHITSPTLEHYATLGLTPESLSIDVGYGFAIVFTLAMLGYGVAVVKQVIRQI